MSGTPVVRLRKETAPSPTREMTRSILALLFCAVLSSNSLAQNQAQLDGQTLEPSARSAIAAQIESGRNSNQEQSRSVSTGSGPAVDAQGNTAEDPTQDVLAFIRAATQRNDDLRNASERFTLALLEAAEKINALRWEHAAQARAAETRRVDEVNGLRAEHQKQLAEAEAKRIDAIRAVDVNAVQNATESAAERATVLAQNVDTSAETLRTLVSSTAQSIANAQEQLTSGLSNRITQLEQAQNFGAGRQTLSDPATMQLTEVVNRLVAAQNTGAGQTTGSSDAIGSIVTAIGAVVGLLTIIGLVVALLRRPQHPPVRAASRRP